MTRTSFQAREDDVTNVTYLTVVKVMIDVNVSCHSNRHVNDCNLEVK
jgi:hypothetical protein